MCYPHYKQAWIDSALSLMNRMDRFLLFLLGASNRLDGDDGADDLLESVFLGKQMYSYLVSHCLLLEVVHSSLVHEGLAVVTAAT